MTISDGASHIDGKTILITGGTGSFGHAYVEETLKKFSPRKVIVYSRDEMKQWKMAQKFSGYENIRFFVGDVRDKDRLARAFSGVDVVIHAAATKIVTTAEYNPFECIKTNIIGAMNVIDCAIDNGVGKVVALSTDKASSPVNIYGATKLVSDKAFISGNSYSKPRGPTFSVVRYGNVMGSRGSVIPLFIDQAKQGLITVTDPRMTRFMITLTEAVELVWKATAEMVGGEIYIKKIPSMKIMDLAKVIGPSVEIKFTGIRPGEKLHEELISKDEATTAYKYQDHIKILPAINNWHLDKTRIAGGVKVADGFHYSSDTNDDWMSEETLENWLKSNLHKLVTA